MSQRPMPTVRQFMTRAPHCISANASLLEVKQLLREHGVRHLPVVNQEGTIGILSSRSVTAAALSPQAVLLKAQDIMTPDPVRVAPQTGLNEVAALMAEDKFGCVLVEEEGKLIGIFTTVDANRALAQVLEMFYPS